jgi:hypothetical protein
VGRSYKSEEVRGRGDSRVRRAYCRIGEPEIDGRNQSDPFAFRQPRNTIEYATFILILTISPSSSTSSHDIKSLLLLVYLVSVDLGPARRRFNSSPFSTFGFTRKGFEEGRVKKLFIFQPHKIIHRLPASLRLTAIVVRTSYWLSSDPQRPSSHLLAPLTLLPIYRPTHRTNEQENVLALISYVSLFPFLLLIFSTYPPLAQTLTLL